MCLLLGQTFVSEWDDNDNRSGFRMNETTLKLSYFQIVGSVSKASYTMTNNWGANADQWYHIALVRNSTVMLIFIDGVSQELTEDTAAGANTFGDFSSGLFIGQRESAEFVNGHIDEFHISKGIARWTANFVPPAAWGEDATVTPAALALTGTLQTSVSEIRQPVATVATALTLNAPSIEIRSHPAVQTLDLTLGTPVSEIRSFPAAQALAFTLQTPTPLPVGKAYDPLVKQGCPQCGTYLYEHGGRSLPSDNIQYGENQDDKDEDTYVRCGRCGWPCKISRERRSNKHSREGWGITYTMVDRTAVG